MAKQRTVLIVANRTACGEDLLREVRLEAIRGAVRFHLLVPAVPAGLHRVVDPEVAGRKEATAVLDRALPRLSAASGSLVTGAIGDADPLAAIQDALHEGDFDAVLLSTLPRRMSRWLRIDLVSKVRGLGLPVSHVEATERERRAAIAA